jgi:signal transduction histidine kinase
MAMESVGTFCHTGVVTMVQANHGNIVIADEGGNGRYLFSTNRFAIRRGDVVEASGDLVWHDNGELHESLRRVVAMGHVTPPRPKPIAVADLASRDFIYQPVTLTGTLVLSRLDEIDASAVRLLVKDGSAILNAAYVKGTNGTDAAAIPLGAHLRLTGVMLQAAGDARQHAGEYLYVFDDGLEVVSPPPDDIFTAPALQFNPRQSLQGLFHMDARRFDGVVLATWGGDQIMLEGNGFRRIKATLARPEELPVSGDRVEVVGFPDTDLYSINLIYARCRRSAYGISRPQRAPTATTLRHLLTDERGRPRINGYSHGRLLRIKGTVLDVQPSLALFSLNDDELTIPVDCSSSPDAMSRIETNSRIEAVVLAIVETDRWSENMVLPQTRGLKLVLRSADDLKVLAHAPWWTPARLTGAIVFLAVVAMLILVANRIVSRMIMRRKVSERTRLAVELHDSLSQTLAGVACQIAAGSGAVDEDPAAAKALLSTAERMLESSRTELKNCLFDLRSDTVDDPDFERAVSKTLTGLKPDARISVRFSVARSMMDDTTAHAVLCIVRELVSNAVSHGAARNAWVAGAESEGMLRFSVRDDGRGFDPMRRPGPREGHFGLAGIRERLAELGGEMTIESEAGRGSKVTVSIKLVKS